MGRRDENGGDEAPDTTPCVRCGAPAEGGFVTGSGNRGFWRFLHWDCGPLSRRSRRDADLLDKRFMGVARRATRASMHKLQAHLARLLSGPQCPGAEPL